MKIVLLVWAIALLEYLDFLLQASELGEHKNT